MVTMDTDGTGFISSRLIRTLVEQNESVVVFDVFPNFKCLTDLLDEIKIVQGDITQLNEVIEAIKTHNVEYIYHTAAFLSGFCQVERGIELDALVKYGRWYQRND